MFHKIGVISEYNKNDRKVYTGAKKNGIVIHIYRLIIAVLWNDFSIFLPQTLKFYLGTLFVLFSYGRMLFRFLYNTSGNQNNSFLPSN